MSSTPRSATALAVALNALEIRVGIIDTSNTRSPSTPRTFRSGVSTARGSSSRPILHVPQG